MKGGRAGSGWGVGGGSEAMSVDEACAASLAAAAAGHEYLKAMRRGRTGSGWAGGPSTLEASMTAAAKRDDELSAAAAAAAAKQLCSVLAREGSG